MVTDGGFRQVEVGGHHRRQDAVTDIDIKHRHIITGGGRRQDNNGGEQPEQPAPAKREEQAEEIDQRKRGQHLGGQRQRRILRHLGKAPPEHRGVKDDPDIKGDKQHDLLLGKKSETLHGDL